MHIELNLWRKLDHHSTSNAKSSLLKHRYFFQNCTIVAKEHPYDRPATWTGPGYTRVHEGTELEFTGIQIPRTMHYDVVVRYQTQGRGDWEVARITIERPDGYDHEGACSDVHPSYEQNVQFALPEQTTSVSALNNICLEHGKVYKVKLYFERHRLNEDNPAAQILIDSVCLILIYSTSAMGIQI